MTKLPGLDHLRALAITLVFFFHYQSFGHPDWVHNVCWFGWMGVDLFFVLSGFLIAGQLFARLAKGKPIQYGVFFTKRLFRIIPAYLTVLALYILFSSSQERPPLAPVWRYLTFTVNFGLDLSKTGTFTHAWSLCIEEQFYLILPLMLGLLYRRFTVNKAIIIVLLLFITGILLRSLNWYEFIRPNLKADDVVITWYKYIYYPTYTRLDGLLVGISIAGLYTYYPNLKHRANSVCNWLILFGMILLAGACYLFKDETSFAATTFGFTLVSVAFGFILAGAVSPSCFLFSRRSKVTTALASLSYAVYLSHKMIIHCVQTVLASIGIAKDSNLMLLICVVAVIIGAYMLRYVIELPFLRLRDKALMRLKGSA